MPKTLIEDNKDFFNLKDYRKHKARAESQAEFGQTKARSTFKKSAGSVVKKIQKTNRIRLRSNSAFFGRDQVTSGYIGFFFQAINLPNADKVSLSDPGILVYEKSRPYQPGTGDDGEEDAIYSPSSQVDDPRDWRQVGATEVLMDDLNPVWKHMVMIPFKGDQKKTLEFRVHNFNGKHVAQSLGKVQVDCHDLVHTIFRVTEAAELLKEQVNQKLEEANRKLRESAFVIKAFDKGATKDMDDDDEEALYDDWAPRCEDDGSTRFCHFIKAPGDYELEHILYQRKTKLIFKCRIIPDNLEQVLKQRVKQHKIEEAKLRAEKIAKIMRVATSAFTQEDKSGKHIKLKAVTKKLLGKVGQLKNKTS